MNTVQQEIATPKACNKILFFNAAIAAIITAGVALTVFVYSFSRLAAIFMPIPALAGVGYFVWRLVQLKEFKSLFLHGFYCALALILGAMVALNRPDAQQPEYAMMLSFCALVLVSAYVIITMRKEKIMAANAVYGAVMCFAVILCLFFMSKTTGGYKIFLWRDNVLEMSFKAVSLTVWGVAVFSAAAIFLICYLFCFGHSRTKITTKYVTYTAMFAAMSVVFKILGNAISNLFPNPYLRLTFVYIPWVMSGIVLGPVGGVIAAGVGDFLGQILLPTGGAWFWLTWISNLLIPLFPALSFMFLRLGKNLNWLKTLIGMSISTAVCTMGLGTLALTVQYNSQFWPTFINRFPQLIVVGINYALIVSLLPVLDKLKITKLKFFEPINESDNITTET